MDVTNVLQVSVQQSVASLIQSSAFVSVEAKRRLLDILTDEFEKLRRLVTLFNMPVSELEVRRSQPIIHLLIL